MVRRRRRGSGAAKGVARSALAEVFGPAAEIGRLRVLGAGLGRRAVGAQVELDPDPDGRGGAYVALVPHGDAEAELEASTMREAAVLSWLAAQGLPLRLPLLAGVARVGGSPILVQRCVGGLPLEPRGEVEPWCVTGEVAAAIHAVDPTSCAALADGHRTRRAHAEARLAEFDGLDAPVAIEARRWALEHLPPDDPASLLHGDLLGQNLRVVPWRDLAPGVIDWAFAEAGDPAYDLAIVTRGVRRPFRKRGGMHALLEAYAEAGGPSVTEAEVRLHELCLAAGWYREALTTEQPARPPQDVLDLMQRVLEVAGSGFGRGSNARTEVQSRGGHARSR